MRNILIASVLILFACKSPHMKSQQLEQGVRGQVRWFQGNMMPSIGGDTPNGKAVEREIYFCQPLKLSELQRDESNTLFLGVAELAIKHTTSDAEGNYKIELAPGEYSVFTKEENGFYANQFNGEGYVNIVKVEKDEITTLDIKITYQASF